MRIDRERKERGREKERRREIIKSPRTRELDLAYLITSGSTSTIAQAMHLLDLHGPGSDRAPVAARIGLPNGS